MLEQARAHPSLPTGDGSEYDKEDAEHARRQRLGATSSSRFLSVGVDNQVTWPNKELLIEFDRYKLVLMPKTKDHVQSIHVDLHANRLGAEEATTVINRFLSLMTWCALRINGSSIATFRPPRRRNVLSRFYREARNAEQNFMISYAVLNYYKIIEIRHSDGPQTRAWFAKNFPAVRDDPHDQHGIAEFLAACGNVPPERYIYDACRLATAHASHKHSSDPDDTSELGRLHNAADVLRRLARHFISAELGVSDSPLTDEIQAKTTQAGMP
jgi:hypothetical protein